MSTMENPELQEQMAARSHGGQKPIATRLRAKLALSRIEILTADDEWDSMSAAVASRVTPPAKGSVNSTTTPWTPADFAPSSQG